jgi:hypothetical protein
MAITALPGSVTATSRLSVADENLHAQLVFEGANLLGDAGLGGVEGFGGLRDVQVAPGDLGQATELLELHSPICSGVITSYHIRLCENNDRPYDFSSGTMEPGLLALVVITFVAAFVKAPATAFVDHRPGRLLFQQPGPQPSVGADRGVHQPLRAVHQPGEHPRCMKRVLPILIGPAGSRSRYVLAPSIPDG